MSREDVHDELEVRRRDVAWTQTVSFSVNALISPPTLSISRAMSKAERRAVPLNTMCSRKCE